MVNEECYPYISGMTGTVEKCKLPRRANLMTMQCQLVNAASSRTGSEPGKQRKSLFRTPPAYRIAQKDEDIMNEIKQRGSVQGLLNSYIN